MSWSTLEPVVRETAERELTAKQLDVWKLHLAGCSYRRIAMMLDIAVPTVRGHLEATHLRLERNGIVRTGFRTYGLEDAA